MYINRKATNIFQEIEGTLDKTFRVGITYDDFNDGKWIKLTDKQKRFHLQNPHASIQEVLSCKLNEITVKEEDVVVVKGNDIRKPTIVKLIPKFIRHNKYVQMMKVDIGCMFVKFGEKILSL